MTLTTQIVALRKRARRCLRRSAGANAIVRPAPGRDDRRDSDVAEPRRSEGCAKAKAIAADDRRHLIAAPRVAEGVLVDHAYTGHGSVRPLCSATGGAAVLKAVSAPPRASGVLPRCEAPTARAALSLVGH